MSGARDSGARGGDAAYRPLPSFSSLTLAVQSAADVPSLVAAVARHVLDLARADRFTLLLLDHESGELAGDRFERGVEGSAGRCRLAAPPGGFLAQILRRETIVTDEAASLAAPERAALLAGGDAPGTLYGVPVLAGTSLLGVAVLGYDRRRRPSARRGRWLHLIADQIGLALDRIRTRGELDRANAALEEARAALRRADEAKTDLISIVSHELRTPLTAIKAYTETLIDNIDNPEFGARGRFLAIIEEECDRLTRMVNDVLDLSRMDSGRRKLRPEAVDLRALVAEVEPTVAPALRARSLRLAYEEEPGLPPVEADPDLLKQVLVNLVHNAAKFANDGTPVTVRAARRGERLELAVEDHGPGIPPEEIGRVFERFYRIEPSEGGRIGGTGLGLAIVKSVVELHGGTIRAESEVGKGTRLVMEIPLVQRGFRSLVRSLDPFFEESSPLRPVLTSCASTIAEVTEAQIVSLMFYTEDASELVIRAAVGLEPSIVARSRVKAGSSIAGWVAHTSENLLVNDIESDRRFRRLNHPQYATKSLLCVPLRVAGETVGVVNVSGRPGGAPFDVDDLNLLVAITGRVGAAIERARSASSAEEIETALHTVRAALRARRMSALRSSLRGFKLATELGRRLGLPEEDVEVLGYVARVHDVGMLSIYEGVPARLAPLTVEDRDRLERHPQEGIRALRPIEFASRVNEIILAHHERHDGHGYPRGLAGHEIPLPARILAAVDAFESMTMGRPYREPMPVADALAELARCAGTQFDPAVVEALAQVAAGQPGGAGRADAGGRPPLAGTSSPR
jgi:signal transduction histidine kinase/HD-GYP domain-containing protein (c-di-GMP phosphodiesterase class II)